MTVIDYSSKRSQHHTGNLSIYHRRYVTRLLDSIVMHDLMYSVQLDELVTPNIIIGCRIMQDPLAGT